MRLFRTFVAVRHRGNANFEFLRLPLYQSSIPRLLWYVDREVTVVGRHGCSTERGQEPVFGLWDECEVKGALPSVFSVMS
jgi:hypothetical protein